MSVLLLILGQISALVILFTFCRDLSTPQMASVPRWIVLVLGQAASSAVGIVLALTLDTDLFELFRWAVFPPAVAVAAVLLNEATFWETARGVIVMVLVWFHSLRLLAHLMRSYMYAKEESWKHLAVKSWPLAPLFSATLFHALPALLVAGGTSQPFLFIFRAVKDSPSLGPLDLAALAVTAAGTILETVADEDLYIYRLASEESKVNGRRRFLLCKEGAWSHLSRPNYLGEWLYWFGLGLFSFAAGGDLVNSFLGSGLIAVHLSAQGWLMQRRLSSTRTLKPVSASSARVPDGSAKNKDE